MEINKDNYFSLEADREYFSVSQFKSFKECEAKTIAKLNGVWEDGQNDAFTLGSYVHLWSEGGNLGEFRVQHPEMFKKDGNLKANFKVADKIIETLSKDPLVEKVREGQKEVIFTGELYGAKWKIMIDIYNPSSKYFADLKTTRSIQMKYWNEELKVKQNFIEYYDYLLQMAVYAEIERQNRGGEDYLQPHIIAVSKEEIPDKAVILVGTEFIKDKLLEIESLLPHFIRVKNGEEVPTRCGRCDYCRSTKQISKIIHYTEL
ncbi:hypothetical protein I9Y31_000040 [Clostridium perfringens]|nr:hypothetical protein [Clostridium perfringens]